MQSRLVHCKLKYTWNMKHELGNGNIVNYSRFGWKICNYVRYYYAHCMYTIYNLDDLVGNKGVQINTVSMHTFINLLNIYSLASNCQYSVLILIPFFSYFVSSIIYFYYISLLKEITLFSKISLKMATYL